MGGGLQPAWSFSSAPILARAGTLRAPHLVALIQHDGIRAYREDVRMLRSQGTRKHPRPPSRNDFRPKPAFSLVVQNHQPALAALLGNQNIRPPIAIEIGR